VRSEQLHSESVERMFLLGGSVLPIHRLTRMFRKHIEMMLFVCSSTFWLCVTMICRCWCATLKCDQFFCLKCYPFDSSLIYIRNEQTLLMRLSVGESKNMCTPTRGFIFTLCKFSWKCKHRRANSTQLSGRLTMTLLFLLSGQIGLAYVEIPHQIPFFVKHRNQYTGPNNTPGPQN